MAMKLNYDWKSVIIGIATVLIIFPLISAPSIAATQITMYNPSQVTTNSMVLTWSQSGDWCFTSYTVYESEAGGAWTGAGVITTISETTITTTNLKSGTQYSYYLTDTDCAGSKNSNTVTATTLTGGSGNPLSVTATTDTTSGPAPLTVSFTASATGGTSPYTYAWDFGDSTTGTGASKSHTYSNAGTFSASVIVTDSKQATKKSSTISITVSSPKITLSNPTQITANSMVLLWSKSGDWLFTSYGVYQSEAGGAWTSIATITNIDTTTYTATSLKSATQYSYYIIDTDSVGSQNSNTVTATTLTNAGNPLSVLANSDKTSGTAPLIISFSAYSTSGGAGPPYTYAWDFGDSTTGSGASPSHTYTKDGTFYASVTVTDTKQATTKSSPITIIVTASGGGGGGGGGNGGNGNGGSGSSGSLSMALVGGLIVIVVVVCIVIAVIVLSQKNKAKQQPIQPYPVQPVQPAPYQQPIQAQTQSQFGGPGSDYKPSPGPTPIIQPQVQTPATSGYCSSCGTPIEGPFCKKCGQKN
jgi:PKD repeat protein